MVSAGLAGERIGNARRGAAWLAGALLLSLAAAAADWPQFRGPNRDGKSPESIVNWPPQMLWTFEAGLGYSSVVVSDGRAYLTGHAKGEAGRGTDTVYCLDAASGQVIWTHKYECLTAKSDDRGTYYGPRATPTVAAGAVYTVSLEGHLFCLDAATGQVRWFQDLNDYAFPDRPGLLYGFCSSPLVHAGKVMCYVNGALMVFEAASGKPQWRCKGGRPLWNGTSPVLVSAAGKQYVVFGEEEIIGADAETGDKAWNHVVGRVAVTTPIVAGDAIFYAACPNSGACGVIRLTDGQPRPLWTNRDMQNYHVGAPVLLDGFLYGVDCSRTEYCFTSDTKVSTLNCLEFATGKTRWTEKKMGWAQVVAADNKLLVQRERGELILVEASPDAYKELGRANLPEGVYWTVPAIANGRMYFRDNAGKVLCFKTGE